MSKGMNKTELVEKYMESVMEKRKISRRQAEDEVNLVLKLMTDAAVGRAAVVDPVLAAEVLLAQRPERGHEHDVPRVHQRGVGESHLQRQLHHSLRGGRETARHRGRVQR